MIAVLKSIPVLTASAPMSESTASIWAATISGRHLVDGLDADRVLGGDRRDRRGAVDAEGGEGLEIGLDPGATARIGAGDRQRARPRTASLSDRAIGGRHGMLSLLTIEMPSFEQRDGIESGAACFLRWYEPDQVRRVCGGCHTLSAERSPEAFFSSVGSIRDRQIAAAGGPGRAERREGVRDASGLASGECHHPLRPTALAPSVGCPPVGCGLHAFCRPPDMPDRPA